MIIGTLLIIIILIMIGSIKITTGRVILAALFFGSIYIYASTYTTL